MTNIDNKNKIDSYVHEISESPDGPPRPGSIPRPITAPTGAINHRVGKVTQPVLPLPNH